MLHVYVSGCVSVAFYVSANLVAGWMLFFSLSMHQCVPNNVLNSIGCVFTKFAVLVHFGIQMSLSGFVVKKSNFKVTMGPTCWPCYRNTGLNFARLSALMHFGTWMNTIDAEVKDTAGPRSQLAETYRARCCAWISSL